MEYNDCSKELKFILAARSIKKLFVGARPWSVVSQVVSPVVKGGRVSACDGGPGLTAARPFGGRRFVGRKNRDERQNDCSS